MPWKTLAAGAAGMAQCDRLGPLSKRHKTALKGLKKLQRYNGLRNALYVDGPLLVPKLSVWERTCLRRNAARKGEAGLSNSVSPLRGLGSSGVLFAALTLRTAKRLQARSIQTNAAATESASNFPRRVRTQFPSTSRSKPSSSNSCRSFDHWFSSSEGMPRTVRRESAILSPRFISAVSASVELIGEQPARARSE
jgi:hypothetical protein